MPAEGHSANPRSPIKMAAFRRAIWFNTLVLAVVTGTGCGVGLFALTHLSLAITGENAGEYLNLLGIFFPGYSASPQGAWVGLFWGFVAAAFSGAFVYQVYARTLGLDALTSAHFRYDERRTISPLTLKISGHALGVALGGLMAAQLILTTSWIVLRGTADESPHAALLAQYLPGYSVSIPGAVVGAAWLFGYAYFFARLFAGVYNAVVSLRQKRGVK
jgi:hypothetical protein